MKKTLNVIVKILRDIKNIIQIKTYTELKLSILKSYIGYIVLNKLNTNPGQSYISKLSVEYPSLRSYEYVFNEIFIKQEYFFETDNKKPFIIDCGSNIGLSILFFKCLYPDSVILGFEPDLLSFDYLNKNITSNKFTDVTVLNKALAYESGEVFFYNAANNPGSLTNRTSLNDNLDTRKHKKTISAINLSSHIDDFVDLLKIDIEGAELDVIKDLDDKDKLKYIDQIFIEYHHHMINNNSDNLSELLSILEKNSFGYQFNTNVSLPFKKYYHQNIVVFAYKK